MELEPALSDTPRREQVDRLVSASTLRYGCHVECRVWAKRWLIRRAMARIRSRERRRIAIGGGVLEHGSNRRPELPAPKRLLPPTNIGKDTTLITSTKTAKRKPHDVAHNDRSNRWGGKDPAGKLLKRSWHRSRRYLRVHALGRTEPSEEYHQSQEAQPGDGTD